MTKRDIVQRCHENTPTFSKALIQRALNLILREVGLSLSRGESVKISNFGTWQRKKVKRKDKEGTHVKFKPSRKLLMYLNSSDIKIKK
ncbi:HU family DNA-binding protein [Thermocrinis sp.]